MRVKGKFDHFNINVKNLQKSIDFYEKALSLKIIKTKEAEDASFILTYLGDECSGFLLELTYLTSHKDNDYELGENESHLCFRVAGDYEEARAYHKEMGCVCYENLDMGLYFISDPDGYWVEILPEQ